MPHYHIGKEKLTGKLLRHSSYYSVVRGVTVPGGAVTTIDCHRGTVAGMCIPRPRPAAQELEASLPRHSVPVTVAALSRAPSPSHWQARA